MHLCLHLNFPLMVRTTYAAESGMQKMESTKEEQDFLIDHLQNRIHYTERLSDVYNSQIKAQAGELRSAEETLCLAASEATGVQLEKKRLLGQWQSTLLAIQFRDDALKVMGKIAQFASRFVVAPLDADEEHHNPFAKISHAVLFGFPNYSATRTSFGTLTPSHAARL